MRRNYRNSRCLFDLAKAGRKVIELEAKTAVPDFWDNPAVSQKILKEIKGLKDKIEGYNKMMQVYEEIDILIDMGTQEEDEDILIELEEMIPAFISEVEQMVTSTLLTGEYDGGNAIVSLHAGAGGTESCDWVAMLYRMYSRWADKNDYKVDVLDFLDGEEAGIKSITFELKGENAYGYIKSEKGVHRLVRISPFDSSGRRHTTFASCDVLPDIEDDIDIDIKDEEMRIDTYRASGAGGQHINKTDSAIRITHLPTGIVVQCQNERSQHKNKDKALQMLKIKLLEKKRIEQQSALEDIRGDQKEIGWGSQIRSYVMHPYNMVKDHRNNHETGNVNAVMDGALNDFINAYLKWLTVDQKQ